MKALKSYLETVIHFKDGTKDWVSPIQDTEEDIYVDDNIISIDNGYRHYDYSLDKIDYVEVVNLLEDEVIDSEIIFKNTPNCK